MTLSRRSSEAAAGHVAQPDTLDRVLFGKGETAEDTPAWGQRGIRRTGFGPGTDSTCRQAGAGNGGRVMVYGTLAVARFSM
ncbi:hypothetical protein GCM10008949_47410 [Deinococcus humi]|nr:hypothetical protein GCM10008949_47410 [Deinococcus humi]